MLTIGLAMLPLVSCDTTSRDTAADVPVSLLRERVRTALADVDRARAVLESDPDEAASRLTDARLTLRRLDEYYLPLLEAREQVSTALDALDSEQGAVASAVDSAEAALLGIVRGHGRHLEGEMRQPLQRLEDVRTALTASDTAEARRVLRKLGLQLESIFFRGELVLEGSELDVEPGTQGK